MGAGQLAVHPSIHPFIHFECPQHASRDKVVADFSQLGSQVMKNVKGRGTAMFALSFLSVISHVYLSYVSSISHPLFFFFSIMATSAV